MKSSTIIIITLSCLLAFCGGIFAGLIYENRNHEDIAAETKSTGEPVPLYTDSTKDTSSLLSPGSGDSLSSESRETPEPERYMLTLSDNGISLYNVLQDGSTSLVSVKDINTSALPKEDYENLCHGIILNSKEEALKMLEGYMG